MPGSLPRAARGPQRVPGGPPRRHQSPGPGPSPHLTHCACANTTYERQRRRRPKWRRQDGRRPPARRACATLSPAGNARRDGACAQGAGWATGRRRVGALRAEGRLDTSYPPHTPPAVLSLSGSLQSTIQAPLSRCIALRRLKNHNGVNNEVVVAVRGAEGRGYR